MEGNHVFVEAHRDLRGFWGFKLTVVAAENALKGIHYLFNRAGC